MAWTVLTKIPRTDVFRDTFVVQILLGIPLPRTMALFIVVFCSRLLKTQKRRISKFGSNVPWENAGFRFGFGRDPSRGSIFVENLPKTEISDYFQNALKICLLQNSDWNYHYHRSETFHFVIVASIKEMRLCIKVDL